MSMVICLQHFLYLPVNLKDRLSINHSIQPLWVSSLYTAMILQKWLLIAIYHCTTKADFFHGDKISSIMIQNSLVWIFFVCFRNKPTKLIKFCMGFYFADFNPEWIFLLLQYIGISHTHFSGQCLKCLFSKR